MNPVDHLHAGGEGRTQLVEKNPQLLGIFRTWKKK